MDYLNDILSYLNKELSPDAEREFLNRLETDEQLRKEFYCQKNLLAVSNGVIDFEQTASRSDISRFMFRLNALRSQEKGMTKRNRWFNFYRAAVIIALPIIVLAGLKLYRDASHTSAIESTVFYTETYVPKGERTKLLLPDGTEVFVNADTRVRIPSNFSPTHRMLWIEGEAHFDVMKDPEHVFLVETPSIDLEILGTSFNLNCYPEKETVETTLESGIVRFAGTERVTIDGRILKPGHTAVYNKDSKTLEVDEIRDNELATGWTDGVLKFRDVTLGELVKKLERRYDVTIVVKDQALLLEKYTGKIRNETIQEVMNNFALATPFNVQYRRDEIIVSK
ncbi:FecR family protein [Marinilabiliaceae bacterium JC017]|nr:FecR family protein [Marinilabiliaceae bacterium JC017]